MTQGTEDEAAEPCPAAFDHLARSLVGVSVVPASVREWKGSRTVKETPWTASDDQETPENARPRQTWAELQERLERMKA